MSKIRCRNRENPILPEYIVLKDDIENQECGMDSLPPEILEMVFSYLDFQRVKICRIVCKGWNEILNRKLLRDGAVISYCESSDAAIEFLSLVKRGSSELRMLSGPFQDLIIGSSQSVTGMSSRVVRLLAELKPSIITVTKILLKVKVLTDAELDLLERCSGTVTTLELRFDIPENTYWAPSQRLAALSFPILEALSVDIGHDIVWIRNFVVNTFDSSPNLKEFSFEGHWRPSNHSAWNILFTRLSFDCIEKLSLDLSFEQINFPQRLLNTLESLKIPHLKSLSLSVSPKLENINIVLPFIFKFAPALHHLDLQGLDHIEHSDLEDFPDCPSLSELYMFDYQSPAVYLSRLPALSSLHVLVLESPTPAMFDVIPCPSVKTLEEKGFCHDYTIWKESMTSLQEQFPNIQYWTLDSRSLFYYEEWVRYKARHNLHSACWKLEGIEVTWCGVNDLAKIPNFMCLNNLRKLRLRFTHNDVNSMMMQKTEFSRLPKLEELEFDWDLKHSISCRLKKNLQSIKNVYVRHCGGRAKPEQVQEFFSKVPNAKCD